MPSWFPRFTSLFLFFLFLEFSDHCVGLDVFICTSRRFSFMNEFFLFQKRGKLGQMKRFTRDLNARALCPSRAIVLLSFVFCVFFPQFSKFVERFFLSFSSRDSFFYLLVVCGSLSDGGHNSQMLRQQPPPLLYWNSKQVEWLFFLLLQFFFEFLFFFCPRPWFVLMCFPTD